MGYNKERELIKSAYPNSIKWAQRVDKMADSQVAAIYMRFRLQNKLKGE